MVLRHIDRKYRSSTAPFAAENDFFVSGLRIISQFSRVRLFLLAFWMKLKKFNFRKTAYRASFVAEPAKKSFFSSVTHVWDVSSLVCGATLAA